MARKKGFTLIELLVVIAIIAVLMGILLPALKKAKNLAQGAVCKSSLKNFGFAVAMYCDDNDDAFCPPESCYFSQSTPYNVESGLSSPIHVRWCNGRVNLRKHPEFGGHLYPYFKEARAFICPAFKNYTAQHSEDHFYQADAAQLGANYDPWYNYTMNAYLGSRINDVQQTRVKKQSEVKRPAETFSFVEESCYVDTAYNISGLNDTFMVPGSDNMVQTWLSHPTAQGSWQLIRPGPNGAGVFWDVVAGFHNAPSGDPLNGKGNCVFLDGHVSAHSRDETFPLSYPK